MPLRPRFKPPEPKASQVVLEPGKDEILAVDVPWWAAVGFALLIVAWGALGLWSLFIGWANSCP